MEEPSIRPADFDLAAYWEQSKVDFDAQLPRYHATVRVAPGILPRMRYAGRFARIERVDPPDAEGWTPVAMRFQFEEEACEYVLSFGAQIEVLEPRELRERVIALARSVMEFYATRNTNHVEM